MPSMRYVAAVAFGLSLAGFSARAETVDLTCAATDRPEVAALYVRVDLAAGSAAAWLAGRSSPAPSPANITASQIRWSESVPPYVVSYLLDRSNGALTTDIVPNNSRAPRTSYLCKRAAGF